jgi:hypothetical protein
VLIAYLTVPSCGGVIYFGNILSDMKYVSRLVVHLTIQGCHGHAGVRRNEIADKLARDGSVQKSVWPEPSFGVSRQNIRRKIKRWLDNQHLARWRDLGST